MKEIERECLLSAVNPRFLLEQIENGYQTVMPFDMLSEMMRSGPRAAFRQFELFALDHAGTSENIGWISNELRGGSTRRKREWYSDVVYLPFEDMMVPAPIGYEEVLKVQYGPDWRTPVKGASGHEKIFIDPDRPYTYYLNDEHRHEIDLDQLQ
jgi:lipopolysaccharide cholinephosphotransferase